MYRIDEDEHSFVILPNGQRFFGDGPAVLIAKDIFERFGVEDGKRFDIRRPIPGARELADKVLALLNASEAAAPTPECATCLDLTHIKKDGEKRACPECQPAMAAEENRDRKAGF
jgi:hypothetical protein